MNDLPLFEQAKFHGAGYDAAKDHARLTGQLKKVHDILIAAMDIDSLLPRMLSLRDISGRTGVPEASASACLRTLRNQFGFVIDKQRVKEHGGTWVYWISGGGMGEYSRKPRKMKPIGDPALFGEMMRCVYAMAHGGYSSFGLARKDSDEALSMAQAGGTWLADLAHRINHNLHY